MLTRRELLEQTARLSGTLVLPAPLGDGLADRVPVRADESEGVELNDVQSRLNATRVRRVVQPKTLDDLQAAIVAAGRDARAISVAGGRHAMGGQQFGRDNLHLDMKSFNRVVRFDREKGLVEAEAGIEWPELIAYLHREQEGQSVAQAEQWGIREKQTGVDNVSLGG